MSKFVIKMNKTCKIWNDYNNDNIPHSFAINSFGRWKYSNPQVFSDKATGLLPKEKKKKKKMAITNGKKRKILKWMKKIKRWIMQSILIEKLKATALAQKIILNYLLKF